MSSYKFVLSGFLLAVLRKIPIPAISGAGHWRGEAGVACLRQTPA